MKMFLVEHQIINFILRMIEQQVFVQLQNLND